VNFPKPISENTGGMHSSTYFITRGQLYGSQE
jgi:hypothetical protein